MPVFTPLGDGGLEGLHFAVAPEGGPPLTESPFLQVRFPWEMLPDDLVALPPQDRALIESTWRGLLQYASSHFAETLHLDGLRSLLGAALHAPRKWLEFPFRHTSYLGAEDARLHAAGAVFSPRTEFPAKLTLRTTGGSQTLAADVGPLSRLGAQRLDLVIEAGGGPTAGWAWVGYWSDEDQHGILVALGPDGRAALGVPGAAGMRWSEIRARISYAEDTTVSLGWAPIAEGEESTLAWVKINEDEYASAEIQEDVSRLRLAGILAPRRSWPMELDRVTFPPAEWSASLLSMRWTDTAVPLEVCAVPLLTDSPLQREVRLYGVSYLLRRTPGEKSRIDFLSEDDWEFSWAPDVALDVDVLQRMFVPLIGVPLATAGVRDTEEDRNLLVGLLYGLLSGPTPQSIAVSLSSMAGVPLCLEEGTVVSTVDPQGGRAIVIRGARTGRNRVYRYGEHSSSSLRIGDAVNKLDLLADGADVWDWVRAGTDGWFPDSVQRRDLEKFSSVVVSIPVGTPGTRLDDEEPTFRRRAEAYMAKVIALWAGTFRFSLALFSTLRETAMLSDYVRWEKTLYLRDALTNGRDYRYNDGHRYDTGLEYNAYLDSILQDRIGFEATNTGDSPTSVVLFGETIPLDLEESVTRMEA